MQNNIFSIGVATCAILLSPVALYPQAAVVFQRLEDNVVQLDNRIRTRIPPVITQGFDALEANETEKALEIWMNSSIPIIQNNALIIADTFKGVIENAVGNCIGYFVIDSLSLTSKTQIIYIESRHDEGALFWRFTVHETPNRPVITSMYFDTDPSEVIPLLLPYLNRDN